MTDFLETLLAAPLEARGELIAARPAEVGEAEVDALAERARAMARSNPADARQIALVAAELAEALGTPRGRALAARALAVALWAAAQWPEALEWLERGERQAESAGDLLLAAQIPILAVDTLAHLGRYDEAHALARDLEARLTVHGAEADAAKVLGNLGVAHFHRGALAEALECWQRALVHFERSGNAVGVASLQVNIANVLTQQSRLEEAATLYDAARATLEAAGMEPHVGAIEGNLGFLQFLAGRYTEALALFERARERFERLGLTKDVAKCEREAADVHRELNLIPEARELYERALPAFAALGAATEGARAELGLAACLAAQGHKTEAWEVLDRVERVFEAHGNALGVAEVKLRRAGWWARSEGREAEAVAEAEAARKRFRRGGVRIGELEARLLQAELRVREGEAPVGVLRTILRQVRQGAFLSLGWRVEAALARAHANAGRERAALRRYRLAVEEIEQVRTMLRGEELRIAYLDDKARLYGELMALLLDRGTPRDLREAFSLAERSRSRALLDQLTTPVAALAEADPHGARLLDRLEALRTQLTWDYGRLRQTDGDVSRFPAGDAQLPGRIRELEREYAAVQRQLQLQGGPAAEAVGPVAATAELQACLVPDERIIEYAAAGDEILAFVLGRRELRTVRALTSRAELEQLSGQLRYQWTLFDGRGGAGPPPHRAAAADQLLSRLYELLIEPLELEPEVRRLTVVPHGPVHSIPIHALRDPSGYALDRWEIAYAPSATIARHCRLRPETEGAGALVFGVADPDIAHVEEEVAALRRLLPGAAVHQGDAATLAAVPQDGEFRYLHFATHAVFRQDSPLFSGLRLADGWLIAHDLRRRRLDCHLATLSACRTGMSRVAAGDEALGLVRSFLHAGARAVMVSLWDADDAATACLMEQCYGELARGVSRAAALRAAQQAVRREYPHPYHWAAFTLVGGR